MGAPRYLKNEETEIKECLNFLLFLSVLCFPSYV
jgi:hypothetical protein